MRSRSITVFSRTGRGVCALCVLALAVAASGCGSGVFGMDSPKDDMALSGSANKATSDGASDGAVMKAEDDSVRLEGKWTWPTLKTDYTKSLQKPRIYPTERVGEGWTFTVIKKGSGYATASGGTVTLKGTSVTIAEESGGEGDSITLTGEVKGDTIVGTVHRSVVAKTLSSGVAQGAGEYDGPWTATRVK
jgi:hypothetical protein